MAQGNSQEREDAYRQALQKATVAIRDLLEENSALKRKEPVAVVGVACRFPGGADSPERFWTLLRDGVDAITEVPPDRWSAAAHYAADPAAAGKMYSVRGGFLDAPVDGFDAGFFGIAPREARSLDPQHRLLLEVAWESLEHACIDPGSLKHSRTGVFVGLSSDDYARVHRHSGQPERIDAYSITGTSFSTAVGRLSYTLGLQGPCMALDTACSSSLVALHLACRSLRAGESDLALVGGVNLMLFPELHVCFSKLQALSPEGRCKTFDATADGYARGEGGGMAVLKLLKDAVRDGNRILAVVRGSAVNQDGKTNGLAAPNGLAQQAVIRDALADAGAQAAEVDYVEAHGTGTILGDPIEVEALGAALGQGRAEPLLLGAVKTNIGHLEPAAGMAGFIKLVLALRHGELPPTLHFRTPNPHIAWDRLNVRVVAERTPWRAGNRPRIAGLSAFGFSGTNAHVIVGEAPAPAPRAAGRGPAVHLLPLSARDEPALRALASEYWDLLSRTAGADLDDLCHSAAAGRCHWPARLAAVGADAAELQQKLADWLDKGAQAPATAGQAGEDFGNPAFLFTGQGSQYPGMGRDLYENHAVFREAIDRCDALLRSSLGRPLAELLFDTDAETLNQTACAQPALFALEYALSELWVGWGVRPAAVMGHSVGEYVAACVAGVFSLEDGLSLIAARGRLMQALPAGGGMAAVFAPEARVAAELALHPGRANIAARNGPKHTVIAGDAGAVRAILAVFEAEGVHTAVLAVSHAFHSHLMEPMLAEFAAIARRVVFSPPKLKLVSNLTGRLAGADIATPEYWIDHIRQPVAFAAGVETLRQEGVRTFLELGPEPTLLGMARRCLPEPGNTWLPSLRRNAPESRQMAEALGALYTQGAAVDWAGVYEGRACRWAELPTYPFQRKRHWMEAPAQAAARPTPPLSHPLLDRMTRSPLLQSILLESRFGVAERPLLGDHRVLGRVLVSAACFTSTLLGGARLAFGAGVIQLADVVFRQALTLPDPGARAVHLLFEPPQPGGVPFRLASLAADSPEDAGTLHVEGSLRILPDGLENGAEPAPVWEGVAPRDLWRRFDREIPGEDVYAALARRHIVWGSSNRWLEAVRLGPSAAVGRLVLPGLAEGKPLATDGYLLHPGLIDCCYSLLLAAAGLHENDRETLVPYALERFSLIRPARGSGFWAHARLRTVPGKLVGDILLTDDEGRPVAECLGLEGRRVAAGLLEADLDAWFYRIDWIAQPRRDAPAPVPAEAGRWLIFMDQAGLGAALAERLRALGQHTAAVLPGTGFQHLSRGGYRVEPSRAADLPLLLDAVLAEARAPWRIVYLWGLDAAGEDAAAALEASIAKTCAPLLHLLQAITATGFPVAGPMALATLGAQAVGAEEIPGVAQAPLWGLGKTLALEHPELGCRRIDLDASGTADENLDFLLRELLAPDNEDQVARRGDARLVARLARLPPTGQSGALPVRADASYLICGGLGGLGRLLARELAACGTRRLVLCGRGEPGPEAVELIADLERSGCAVQTLRADISRAEDAQAVIAAASADEHLPLAGIVHAAGILDDGVLAQAGWARFARALAAKTAGLQHLHEASRRLPLDFFIGYSSFAALTGSPAQGAYVAANGFVDALMQSRRAQGLPGLSVNWGPWAEAGMAARLDERQRARLEEQGIAALPPGDAFRALDQLWPDPPAQAGIAAVRWPAFLRHFPGAMELPLFEALRREGAAESYALGVPASGTLDDLAWREAGRRPPGPGEVEIRVEAAGLNIKDVLMALRRVPDSGLLLGSECAGEVVRVGAGVSHFAAGDRVLAMSPGSFSRYLTLSAGGAVARLPDGMDYAVAATIPVAFLTAAHALEELAGLRAGERVLIHDAAGGIGQAAIQLARRAGAEIYATAGAGDWAALRELGAGQVMDSRSLDFAGEIRRLTAGVGVDVVLNTLGGEFAARSLELLRPGGRFFEIGVGELMAPDDAAAFLPEGASFRAIDLLRLYQDPPATVQALLERLVAAFAAGRLQPLPHTVFAAREAKEAFRALRQAGHTGKIVLAFDEAAAVLPATGQAGSQAPGQARWLDQLELAPPARRRAVLESLLAGEIRRVLGAGGDHPIAPRQPLFDLGMDSLTAVELKNRLAAALACPLSTTLLFDYPTLEALAGHLCAAVPILEFDMPATAETDPAGSAADARETALDQLSQDELEDLLAAKLRTLAG